MISSSVVYEYETIVYHVYPKSGIEWEYVGVSLLNPNVIHMGRECVYDEFMPKWTPFGVEDRVRNAVKIGHVPASSAREIKSDRA